jgi:hypothetical protein
MGAEGLDVVDPGLALAGYVASAHDAGEMIADQRGAACGLPGGGIVEPRHKVLCLRFGGNVKRKLFVSPPRRYSPNIARGERR